MLKKLSLLIGASALLFSGSIAWAAGASWSYSGSTGPKNWANLDPNYAECGWGKEQSPINITSAQSSSMGALQFQFQNIAPNLIDYGHSSQSDSAMVEDTHSLEDNLTASEVSANTLTINGDTYQLTQFHFHMPAEHHILGVTYPMEIHLVYRDAQAHLAVVAILVKKTRLKTANSLLHQIALNLSGQSAAWQDQSTTINLSALIPQDPHYYHYEGSLTTPPCIEGVQWYVMRQPIMITASDLNVFKNKIPGNTARPIQSLNGRVVQKW
ncbi:MAG: cah [Gammaproteobacteria bacterium]|jgi:carbonic anhydrase|nr:cah [Gammaproteobacteria bacterium]